jgi:hypothetical protein
MIGVDAAPNVPFVGPKRRNSTAPAIDAPGARAEGDQLQEATGHGDVLEEMYHLVRVAEIAMRDQRGRNALHRQYDPGWTRLIADDEQNAADAFDDDGDDCRQHGDRQTLRAHKGDGAIEIHELLDATQNEDDGKQQPSQQRGAIVQRVHRIPPLVSQG